MESNRRAGDWMCLLLLLGNIRTSVLLSGAGVNNAALESLECINDMKDMMCCDFEAQNCAEYNLTLRSNEGYGEVSCIAALHRDSGRCRCSMRIILIPGETHNATLRKGGENKGSKVISVTDGMKPNAPTIISVNRSNQNFEVRWRTNVDESDSKNLAAKVTYYKKGDTVKVSESIRPTMVDGLNRYEIHGQHLESSTTYVVSVQSYFNMSRRFSNSSNEVEFTTPMSTSALLLAIIIVLSIVAMILSGAIYGCYVKLKTKWWDTVAKCPNPKLLNMHPSDQEVLKPVLPVISSIYVEPIVADDSKSWSKVSLSDSTGGSPQQSSGISTGSSYVSYANTDPLDIIAGVQDALGKAFGKINPISPVITKPLTELNGDSGLTPFPSNLGGVIAHDVSSGSSGFDNITYSILMPSLSHQITADGSEVQKQAEMHCDSAYHPSEGAHADQQVAVCPFVNLPAVGSSPMLTDMSYRQCHPDSGRFSCAEDSSLSSISSGTNTVASCDCDEVLGSATDRNGKSEEAIICDNNPCYACVPTCSRSFLPVDDDYQAFQNLVGQPHVLFSENQSGEEEERLDKYPEESSIEMPQSIVSPVAPGFTNNAQADQSLSEPQRPFLSLISADQPMAMITDNGYQSV